MIRRMRFPSISWRKKLITTSILCLVLPSILSLFMTGYYTRNQLQKQAVARAEGTLQVSDLYTTSIVQEMITMFNSLQYDSETMNTLKAAWNTYESDKSTRVDFFTYKQIASKLDQLTANSKQSYITILLPDGLYFTNYSTYNSDVTLFYKEPWLVNPVSDPINFTIWLGNQPNYVKEDKDQYPNLITMVRTFQLYPNSPTAYLIVSKPEEQFHQVLNQFASDQLVMLLGADGKVLAGSDNSWIDRSLHIPAATSSDNVVALENGQYYVAVNHPLPYGNWRLVSLTPYSASIGKVGDVFNYIFVLQLLFFLAFGFVLYYLLRQFTKPIIRLTKVASEVEQGNLQNRSGVQGPDEIGKLGLSFDRMLDRLKEMIWQIRVEQTQKRKAELELLQAQINPHFLFNTLNSIRLRALMNGENEIGEVIGSLSTLLRMTINRNNEFVTLHEEVSTVEQYIKLLNFRHQEGIQLETNLASDTLLEQIPRFTLQPLIENAHVHGLLQRSGKISLSSWKKDADIYLCIEDDGVGVSGEKLQEILQELNQDWKQSELQRKNRSTMS
ncbi:MAG: hypothetical protein JWN30_458, partial [Bacilli bacterium]|nr:hypothetical protein [Bacilli bacterium]